MAEPIDVDRVLEDVFRGNDDGVVEAFVGRTEAERRVVARRVFSSLQPVTPRGQSPLRTIVPLRHWDTACAAFFACGSLGEIKSLRTEHHFGQMCNDTTVQILVDRRPSWATAWASWALEGQARASGRAPGMWMLVRKLIRAGVCEPIDTEAYTIGMIFGILSFDYNRRSRWDHEQVFAHAQGVRQTKLADVLLEDPELLDHDVWRIFEVPARPSRQLGCGPRDRPDGWTRAFVSLAASGHLDRDRLLDATLDSLARDIRHRHANWFIRLWRTLEPTSEERTRRQDRLLHLLAHRATGVVDFALDELTTIDGLGRLDAPAFIEEVSGGLMTMPVATVSRALRLLARMATADSRYRTEGLVAATSALLHVNARVRRSAISLMVRQGRPGDFGLIEAIETHRGALSREEVGALGPLGIN